MAFVSIRRGAWLVHITAQASLLFFLGCIAWRVAAHYPCNHWGADVRWGWGLCVPAATASIWLLWRERAVLLGLGGLFIACGSAVALYLVHHRNVLVSYELWIKRGMPGSGQG